MTADLLRGAAAHRDRVRAPRAARRLRASALVDGRAVSRAIVVAARRASPAAPRGSFFTRRRALGGSSSAVWRLGLVLPLSPMTAPPRPTAVPRVVPSCRFRTRISIFIRLLAIQGSWNYETLLGNGIGFCIEPALQPPAGGIHSARFTPALARESSVLQRASVSRGCRGRCAGARRARWRTAGANRAISHGAVRTVGQRRRSARLGRVAPILLACVARRCSDSAPAPWRSSCIFPGGVQRRTLRLRIWGLQTGWTHGLRVAIGVGQSRIASGPQQIGRLAALATGIAIPLALGRIIGPGATFSAFVLVAVALGSLLIVRLQGSHRRVAALALPARRLRPLLGHPLMPERTVQIANQERPPRPARGGDREACREISERDHDREGRSRRERQEHHGRHDARGRARIVDPAARRGPDADAALDALASLVSNKFGER